MPTQKETYRQIYALLLKTRDDSLAWETRDLLSSEGNKAVYFLNAHGVNNAISNSVFATQLFLGDFLLRDGIGVDLAFRLLKLGRTENLNGTDLIPKIIRQQKDRRIAVFGSSDETLRDLRARLTNEGYSNIVSMEHGFHSDEHYVEICKVEKPEIVILCMGMPRQEELSPKIRPHAKLTICGGGWADFYSGTKKRAPVWIQKINLEWLYRLANEPIRLGKRYTIDLLRYFFNVFQVWRFRPEGGVVSTGQLAPDAGVQAEVTSSAATGLDVVEIQPAKARPVMAERATRDLGTDDHSDVITPVAPPSRVKNVPAERPRG